jgi:hypothetical protein
VLGQHGIDPGALARLLVLDRLLQRDEAGVRLRLLLAGSADVIYVLRVARRIAFPEPWPTKSPSPEGRALRDRPRLFGVWPV